MFNKTFEYGNLIHNEKRGFVFITEGKEKEFSNKSYIEVMNELGKEGWELVQSDEQIGFLFKRC